LTAPLGPELSALHERTLARGETPLALLDIDLTLVDNAARNRAIWRDWMLSIADDWPGAAAAAPEAETMPIVFGVRENLLTLGVRDRELQEAGLQFWLKAFFSDAYVRLDTALDGAVEAVARLRDAGVTVAYVTARPERMSPVTMEGLASLGFPMGVAGTILATRPARSTSDHEAKTAACAWLATLGSPILTADNEPAHVNAMHRQFPEAISVLVDTRHSAGAPALEAGVRRVERLLDIVVS